MRGELIKQALIASRPDYKGRIWVRLRPNYICNLAITVRGVGVCYIDGGEQWEKDAKLAAQIAEEFELIEADR